jgi:hypothetical protein
MEKTKLSEPSIKMLKLLKTQEKGMNTSQVASTVKMDERLTAFYLFKLEKNGYTVGDVREEKEGDKPVLRRYHSVTERGLSYLEESLKTSNGIKNDKFPSVAFSEKKKKDEKKQLHAFDSFRIGDIPADIGYRMIRESIERLRDRRHGIIRGCYR